MSFILIAVNVSNTVILTVILAVSLALLCRDAVNVIKRLIPLEIFCLLFILQVFLGSIPIDMARVFILRVNCAALIYMFMVVPLGIGVLAQALLALGVSPKLISILYLSHRYIYLMHDKVFCSIKAMKLRSGTEKRGTAVPRTITVWKSYAAVFAAALLAAFLKADEVSAALRKRGFAGAIPQTRIWVWSGKDAALVIGSCGGVLFYGTYQAFGHLFFL